MSSWNLTLVCLHLQLVPRKLQYYTGSAVSTNATTGQQTAACWTPPPLARADPMRSTAPPTPLTWTGISHGSHAGPTAPPAQVSFSMYDPCLTPRSSKKPDASTIVAPAGLEPGTVMPEADAGKSSALTEVRKVAGSSGARAAVREERGEVLKAVKSTSLTSELPSVTCTQHSTVSTAASSRAARTCVHVTADAPSQNDASH